MQTQSKETRQESKGVKGRAALYVHASGVAENKGYALLQHPQTDPWPATEYKQTYFRFSLLTWLARRNVSQIFWAYLKYPSDKEATESKGKTW